MLGRAYHAKQKKEQAFVNQKKAEANKDRQRKMDAKRVNPAPQVDVASQVAALMRRPAQHASKPPAAPAEEAAVNSTTTEPTGLSPTIEALEVTAPASKSPKLDATGSPATNTRSKTAGLQPEHLELELARVEASIRQAELKLASSDAQ